VVKINHNLAFLPIGGEMLIGYVRISTDKQSIKNQRFEILNFADKKKWVVDEWVEETISSTRTLQDRLIGKTINKMNTGDILVVSELSRLGRSLMDIMSILHDCMQRNIKVITTKEGHEFGNNINSKVLAFAFGLSAEIERNLISQRTKEALARKKKEGKKLGRPKGSLAKTTKLTGKEDFIREMLEKKISVSAIARILGVHRLTVRNFIETRKLKTFKELNS
jgi:DNA invertase Pin-like site-specific DNA recombinase